MSCDFRAFVSCFPSSSCSMFVDPQCLVMFFLHVTVAPCYFPYFKQKEGEENGLRVGYLGRLCVPFFYIFPVVLYAFLRVYLLMFRVFPFYFCYVVRFVFLHQLLHGCFVPLLPFQEKKTNKDSLAIRAVDVSAQLVDAFPNRSVSVQITI